MNRNKVIVFDLDDTLFKEIDFLKSAFRKISKYLENQYNIPNCFSIMISWYFQGKNVFKEINQTYRLGLPISFYIEIYRNHLPSIKLSEIVRTTLSYLKKEGYELGLITDGRTISQRNKIEALKLREFIVDENIVISEEFGSSKPSLSNYQFFDEKYSNHQVYYVGDNEQKDFLAPNKLGWKTICLLNDGFNIRSQNFSLPEEYLPQVKINQFGEILEII